MIPDSYECWETAGMLQRHLRESSGVIHNNKKHCIPLSAS